MKVEIVEFYPHKFKPVMGTLHVYIVDLKMDLRGVRIRQASKNSWFIQLPHFFGKNHETGQKVAYPVITFTAPDAAKNLILAIRKLAIPFVQQWIEEHKKDKP